jgi:predicted metalloprotease with PDZ domain
MKDWHSLLANFLPITSYCPAMTIRRLFQFCALITFAICARAENLSAVNYTLHFDDALHHYVEVEADLPTDGASELDLFLPVWTPGSYLIREYARHIDHISATSLNGEVLDINKTTKNHWLVSTNGHSRVLIKYRLYGWEINVRSNWIEGEFAMIQGAPTYLTLAENYQRPYTVKVELPSDWAGTYTPLSPGDAPHTYTAPDYDTLIDSPLLAGSPQVDHFEIDGATHYLVTIGGEGIWNNARAARNFAHLVNTQKEFWGGLPTKEPYYVFNLLTGQRGGLEHRQAFVMMADRSLSLTRGGIGSWLSLVSHEYFHTWNGKRLRPVELGPFNYEHEAYTRSLWVVEGITSYYQHIMLHRAGFSTRENYLKGIGNSIAANEKIPGRLVQSLSDSSFDAWIKNYRPDENSVNTRVSYYSVGAVAGLLLDTEIRRRSAGTKSLDDVMRAAYSRYSGTTGYTEEQFIALVSEVTGADIAPWIRQLIQLPGQYDYEPMLDWYGLEFEAPKKPDDSLLPNGIEPPDPEAAWLGAETKITNGQLIVSSVRTDTPAYNAGVYVNDELLALNGFRISSSLESMLKNYHPGDKVDLLISRRGHLLTLSVTLGRLSDPLGILKIKGDATPEQATHLEAWLGKFEQNEESDENSSDSDT